MIKILLHKKLHSASGSMQLHVDLQIKEGTFLTLYGKSGAGKTSILRMLAGLLRPDSGHIISDETQWFNSSEKINLPPQKRSIGFVFQDYGLFPNMTVKRNLEFALTKDQDNKIIDELIEMVELGDLQNRKPNSLSGGQQQRVALARSLVQRPQILMLDEPLSALDQEMRVKLQEYILKVHRQYNLTTILVSHDIPEVLKMSDSIVHLDQGKVIDQSRPSEAFSIKQEGQLLTVEKKEDDYILTLLIDNKPVKVIAHKSNFTL